MPEGHSVRIHADRQTKLFEKKRLTITSPQKRFGGAKLVSGRTLGRIETAGKHLFYHFGGRTNPALVHVHLGRLGRFRYHAAPLPPPGENCRMRLATATDAVDLSGPTDCSVITEEKRAEILARLGADPLRADADPAEAFDRIHASKRPIGALLLDQSIIAGLGNIFRAEILFLLRIHPAVPGSELTRRQLNGIWRESVRLLADGVKYGWIVTTSSKVIGKPIEKFRQGDRFDVYHRKSFRLCGGAIQTLTLGGRTIYYCAKHQKTASKHRRR